MMPRAKIILCMSAIFWSFLLSGIVSGSGSDDQTLQEKAIEEPKVTGEVEEGLQKDIRDVYQEDSGHTVIDGGYIDCPIIKMQKDTMMLCIDGCPMNGAHAWNVIHPGCMYSFPGTHCDHAVTYTAQACLAMVAAANGQHLSQDRISYFIFQDNPDTDGAKAVGNLDNPAGDLGHFQPVSGADILRTLNWMVGVDQGAKVVEFSEHLLDESQSRDDYTIRDFLLPGCPIIMESGEARYYVVRGYAIVDTYEGIQKLLYINDPAYPDKSSFMPMEELRGVKTRFYFLPTTGKPMRNDEESISLDSDNDGICDFDEINRFYTDPAKPDTDTDMVNDLQDIVGYVFNRDGSWNYRNPDMDGDGYPKQIDPDNDQPGSNVIDGCEDANHNGFFDDNGTETDCFDPSDDGNRINPECTGGFIRYDGHIDNCDDSYELIRLIPGQGLSRDYKCYFEYNHTECVLVHVGTPAESIEKLASTTRYSGIGQAMALVTRDENDGYTLEFDVTPDQAPAEMEFSSEFSTGLDTNVTADNKDLMMPLFLNDWKLGPGESGTVEVTDNGYIVLRGSYDLYENQLKDQPQYRTQWLQMMRSHHGSAVVSWEIWILEADLEKKELDLFCIQNTIYAWNLKSPVCP